MKRTRPEQKADSGEMPTAVQRFKIALRNSSIILFEHDRDLRFAWIHKPNPEFEYAALVCCSAMFTGTFREKIIKTVGF